MTTQPASLPADQLVVFNTLSGKKEPFVPVTPGHVGMYVCGITPYDFSHVGHARVYVAFDVIYRALKAFGFDVRYVRNYTDIDDKIIKRAAERGIAPEAVAGENIQAFQEDMARLNVLTPTDEPRVTPVPLPDFGDFNGDGVRDAADFAAWLAARSREMPMARESIVSPEKSADSGRSTPRASIEKRGAK